MARGVKSKTAVVEDETEDYFGENEDTAENVPESPATTNEILQEVAASSRQVGAAIENLAKNQTPRKLGIHEREIRSPHNPKGRRGRKFTRNGFKTHVWVNMVPVMPHLAGDAAFACVPEIRPGTYMQGRVSINEQRTGSDTNLYITYPDTRDEALVNKGLWRSFEDLLEQCVRQGPMTAAEIATTTDKR